MNRLNQRGQGSIEIMLIVTSALGLAFLFSVPYLSTQDATIALVIAKNRITEKMQLNGITAIIESIKYNKEAPDSITLKAYTKPAPIDFPQADLDAIQTEIEQSTPFTTVTILMNPAPQS
jgi:hypothetical protein